jgi:hypothetical protein
MAHEPHISSTSLSQPGGPTLILFVCRLQMADPHAEHTVAAFRPHFTTEHPIEALALRPRTTLLLLPLLFFMATAGADLSLLYREDKNR